MGTRRGSFGKDFAAVHGKGPALVIELGGAEWARLVLTADDPSGLLAELGLADRAR